MNKPKAPEPSSERNQEELARRKLAKGNPKASAVKGMTLGGRVRVVATGLVFIVVLGLFFFYTGRTVPGLIVSTLGLAGAFYALVYILRDRS